jgi:hypothetical protein
VSTIALVSGLNTLTQNIVYAMPGKAKWVFSDKVLEVCNTTNGTYTAVTGTTTGGALLNAVFVRSTTGDAVARLTNQ